MPTLAMKVRHTLLAAQAFCHDHHGAILQAGFSLCMMTVFTNDAAHSAWQKLHLCAFFEHILFLSKLYLSMWMLCVMQRSGQPPIQ